jgi:hypothetical protein
MMTPTAQELYEQTVQHILAAADEPDSPNESYEVFGADERIDYASTTPDGRRFFCFGSSLVACRLARDRWLWAQSCQSYSSQQVDAGSSAQYKSGH